MPQQPCRDCGSLNIDHDSSSGSSYCANCGIVFEESNIVADVGFTESSSGQAHVTGTLVAHDATGTSRESRDKTIQEGKRRVRQLAAALRISEAVAESGERIYTLAVQNNFIRGRKAVYIVSACLYAACRLQKDSHMLIDFSDFLQINVFALGTTYLRLVERLDLKLPEMDPSIYIQRFASLLEFGQETQRVASDATRLCRRFDEDFISHGRRPAGICGAALLLAARMNNFRRSVEEIVQVVKIADVTVQKRLDEFSRSTAGDLTIEDFRDDQHWHNNRANEETLPPTFYKARRKEKIEEEAAAKPESELAQKLQRAKEKKRNLEASTRPKRKRNDPIHKQFEDYYETICGVSGVLEDFTPQKISKGIEKAREDRARYKQQKSRQDDDDYSGSEIFELESEDGDDGNTYSRTSIRKSDRLLRNSEEPSYVYPGEDEVNDEQAYEQGISNQPAKLRDISINHVVTTPINNDPETPSRDEEEEEERGERGEQEEEEEGEEEERKDVELEEELDIDHNEKDDEDNEEEVLDTKEDENGAEVINDENIDMEKAHNTPNQPDDGTEVVEEAGSPSAAPLSEQQPGEDDSNEKDENEKYDDKEGEEVVEEPGDPDVKSPAPNEDDEGITQEITQALGDPNIRSLANTLDNVDERRRIELERRNANVDELQGLDESELDDMILGEDEVRVKERIWMEFNKDYLEKIALHQATGQDQQKKPRRKKRKAKDQSAKPENAAEAASQVLKQRKISKKINYNALDGLFKKDTGTPEINSLAPGEVDDKDDDKEDAKEDEEEEGEDQTALEYGAEFSDNDMD
ncbi:BRF1-domain-containing protein [Wallemia mellicola]|nr:BRF1-domain-containing protein [Wallemia mellicola]TIC58203.1 BRF1-domain-containing protein [Wallemia mellicola]